MMRAISVTICRDRRPDSPVAPRTPLPDEPAMDDLREVYDRALAQLAGGELGQRHPHPRTSEREAAMTEEAARRTSYGYRWGQYLAAVEAIAEAADSLDPPVVVNHWEKIRAQMVTTTMLPKVTTLTTLWLRRIRNAPARRARQDALDESLAALAGWDAMRSPRHLTVQEQADMWLGYHQQRRQWRDERRERAAERESA